MSLYAFFRVSKPSADKVPESQVDERYRKLRRRTFIGVSLVYSLFYICRMTLSVVKQPVIDAGILNATQLGVIGSALLLAYAFGKFINGFIADYCNIRRFMAVGIGVSAIVNAIMFLAGIWSPFTSATALLLVVMTLLWGINGWAQSMGASPGVISLSRWYPLKIRGTMYSIFSATPYLGKFLSLAGIGYIVSWLGWQAGFGAAALAGVSACCLALALISDNPESKGLPPVAKWANEAPQASDSVPTKQLQKYVFTHRGIWVIAISSAFVYITQYGLSNWGVLFLQKSKNFPLAEAAMTIGFSEMFGIAGTVAAGWLSDKIFKGNRVIPVIISGLVCLLSLALFLFAGGGYVANLLYVSLFSLAIGVLYCIVGGLMALDIVPRKATGAAVGIVGISSYIAAGVQDIVSGYLIQKGSTGTETGGFTAVSIFWLCACAASFLIPALSRKILKPSQP